MSIFNIILVDIHLTLFFFVIVPLIYFHWFLSPPSFRFGRPNLSTMLDKCFVKCMLTWTSICDSDLIVFSAFHHMSSRLRLGLVHYSGSKDIRRIILSKKKKYYGLHGYLSTWFPIKGCAPMKCTPRVSYLLLRETGSTK